MHGYTDVELRRALPFGRVETLARSEPVCVTSEALVDKMQTFVVEDFSYNRHEHGTSWLSPQFDVILSHTHVPSFYMGHS